MFESTSEICPIILDLFSIYDDYENYCNDYDFQVFADESKNIFFGIFYSSLKCYL